MTIDIDRCISPGRINTVRPGNIIDERHNDSKFSELPHKVVHIVSIRKFDSFPARRVLILRLEKNDRAAVRDLSFSDNLGDGLDVACADRLGPVLTKIDQRGIFHILFRSFLVSLVWCAKLSIDPLQPSRKPSTRDLRVDVWARSLT